MRRIDEERMRLWHVTRYDVAGRTSQLARSSLMCVAVQHVSSSSRAIQLNPIPVLTINIIVLFEHLYYFLFPLQHTLSPAMSTRRSTAKTNGTLDAAMEKSKPNESRMLLELQIYTTHRRNTEGMYSGG